jgi:hypothetical protein
MWMDLYLVSAVVVAVAAWLVSPHFQSYDPPGDISRAFWSVAAGALWPLILVGAAQVLTVRYVARRASPRVLRGAGSGSVGRDARRQPALLTASRVPLAPELRQTSPAAGRNRRLWTSNEEEIRS